MTAGHWALVAGLLAVWSATASWVNVKIWSKTPDMPQWQKVVHFFVVDWPAFLPSIDYKSLFGLPFNIPFLSYSATKDKETPTPPPLPPVAVLVFLAASFFQMSCSCFNPETRNTPACVILHNVIDCTEVRLFSLGPATLALIQQYAQGDQTPDWAMIEARLEAAGIKDAGCILAQIENNFILKASATAPGSELETHKLKTSAYHDFFVSWKQRHHLSDVKFRIKLAGRTEVLR